MKREEKKSKIFNSWS